MKQVLATVISNNKVMPQTYLIWLECSEIASSAQPGQFVMIDCGEDVLLRRPLSFHQVDGDKFALLFTVIGKGTQWLTQRQVDDCIGIFGPLGNGFSIQSTSTNLLLIAGGMGIAPLSFLAEVTLNRGYSVTLLYGTASLHRYPAHLLPSGIKLISTTEDGSVGHHGLITDILPRYAEWANQIFACGPVGMYRAMAQMPELKDKPVQVSLEARMACGRGVCYGCTIKTKHGLKRICQDGPVFELADLEDTFWDEPIL